MRRGLSKAANSKLLNKDAIKIIATFQSLQKQALFLFAGGSYNSILNVFPTRKALFNKWVGIIELIPAAGGREVPTERLNLDRWVGIIKLIPAAGGREVPTERLNLDRWVGMIELIPAAWGREVPTERLNPDGWVGMIPTLQQ